MRKTCVVFTWHYVCTVYCKDHISRNIPDMMKGLLRKFPETSLIRNLLLPLSILYYLMISMYVPMYEQMSFIRRTCLGQSDHE